MAINTSKEEITKLYGEEYSKPRNYVTHSKGAQEAHEAIRPTFMSDTSIEGTVQEKRLYELIWKRTAASQMADAMIEKTTATIEILPAGDGQTLLKKGTGSTLAFVANGEVVAFDGFLKVYRESTDDEENGQQEQSRTLASDDHRRRAHTA